MTGLIYALDTSEFGIKEKRLLGEIAEHVDVIKIGLELMTAVDAEGHSLALQARRFVREELKKDVMWDIKLLDVANTMEKAVSNIGKHGVLCFTLHAHASDTSLLAVSRAAAAAGIIPLAVTVLTDIDDGQCISRFGENSNATVLRFAQIALALGITGFVCSPKEAPIIAGAAMAARTLSFTIVTPGIRPTWAVALDEQKRVTTPAQARDLGASYIVVGRPISNPPASVGSPKVAARLIREELVGK